MMIQEKVHLMSQVMKMNDNDEMESDNDNDECNE